MNNFTFLTDEQIFGHHKLDILIEYGTKCAITDFSILLGGRVSGDYHTSEGRYSRNNRTGFWWTKTPYENAAHVVHDNGACYWNFGDVRSGGARPALPYSSISSISSNGERGRNGILEVEYGEYPQTVVSEDFSRILEMAFANMPYSNNEMKTTGKSYTTDSVRYQDSKTPFQARTHTEYEYNGKKYIRFVGDSNCSGKVLSDGRTIQDGSPYWVKVEPIKWMIDERTNIALSKKLIFSGVQFNRIHNYKGDFDRTDIKEFMDRYFSKDIAPSFSREITPGFTKDITPGSTKVITLDDVLNDNYTESDLQMNTFEIYTTIMGLFQVDEANFAKVRDFVLKLGGEPCAIFDLLWTNGNEARMEIVTEARLANNRGGRRV